MKKSMIKLNETFSPGQEIMTPKHFAGRVSDIERAVQALSRAGSCIIVYGDRGVGKTSFVEMIKLIAKGNVDLLYRHNLHKKYPTDKLRYQVLSIECDAETNTSEKVLQRLMTSPEGVKQIIQTKIDVVENCNKDKSGISILNGLLNAEGSNEQTTYSTPYSELSIVEMFTNVILTIQYQLLDPKEGLLIVIDEFDQVKESRILASLVKTLGKERVKFVFSGIAETYENLIEGHQSIIRQLFYGRIKIDLMNKTEFDCIFDIAENTNNNEITFNKAFREEAFLLSEGYPYYAQLFGQLSLDAFVDIYGLEGKGAINSTHLKKGLDFLMENEPQMETAYNELVNNNTNREIMLYAIASQTSRKQKRSDILRFCEKNGVSNPGATLIYLLGLKIRIGGIEENVLLKHGKDYISFSNPLFKIFVRTKKMFANN